MDQDFSELQILSDLGLTITEAKVYLALNKAGSSKVSEISESSKVARTEVYETLLKLQRVGLVEKIIETPHRYKAIPLTKGIEFLLTTKTEKYRKVLARAKLLLDKVAMADPNSSVKIETSQYFLISRGMAVMDRIRTAIEGAQKSMDLVLSWKRFSRAIVSTFSESLEIAWAKNVKIRFILEAPSESKTAMDLVEFCREKPFCQIRFIRHHPRTIFGVFDAKETSIVANPKADLPDSPTLWSNNSSLVSLAQDYFEALWSNAMDKPHFEVNDR